MPERVSPRDMLDIIFANRNRAYGAYLLRREYPHTMRRALGWGMLLVGFFIVLPHLITAISAALPEKDMATIYETGLPPVIEATTPPPPVIETPPPPSRPTKVFVPPLVVVEEQPENVSPAMEELLQSPADIGSRDQAGDPDVAPTIIDNPTALAYVEAVKPVEDNETYDMVGVQKPPTFPGGEHDLLKFLAENIRYPELARENNIAGNVALTFVINKDGSVSDAQILKDIGGGCGKEALRVVGLMPRWSPGEANSHPVKVRFALPVRFRLD